VHIFISEAVFAHLTLIILASTALVLALAFWAKVARPSGRKVPLAQPRTTPLRPRRFGVLEVVSFLKAVGVVVAALLNNN